MSLWLVCTPALRKYQLPSGQTAWVLDEKKQSAEINLSDELVSLLNQAGRPMPMSQPISKLPAGIVVTVPMLSAAAQQSELKIHPDTSITKHLLST